MKPGLFRFAALFALILPFIPFLIWQQDAYVRLHDTLEGELVWLELLRQSGLAFDYSADAILPNVLGGLARNTFPPGHSLPYFFIHAFGMFWGYVLLSFCLSFIGFLGMRSWVQQTYPESAPELAWTAAVLFAWIPFFPTFGTAVMGLPWLWLSFRRLYRGQGKILDVAIWFLFPFTASFIWSAILLSLAWASLLILQLRQPFKSQILLWSAAFAWGLGVLLAHYPSFALMFSGFESHRQEYLPFPDGAPSLMGQLQSFVQMALFSHYHVGTLVTLPILLLLLLAWPQLHKRSRFTALFLLLVLLFQAFYPSLEYLFFQHIEVIRSMRLDRLSTLFPLLWLILLVDSSAAIWTQVSYRRVAIMVWGCVLLTTGFGNDQNLQNLRKALGKDIMPSYRNYLAVDQMKKIQWFIGKPLSSYRVASLGLSPSIAQFNGFYTVDGLQSQYPLRQKHRLGNIMKAELEKAEACRRYFQNWGNRAYLFSAELGCDFQAIHQGKGKRGQIQHLDFNVDAMHKAELNYLLSAVILPPSSAYRHLRSFHNGDSWWTIHLYEIQPI
jgi:hypothetical protein